ncbi:MAG TPA: nucleotidyl transferase AbiEii/AbiGii toxin family protein [Streptosporangiaceae bacterium]|nr:nucleotidyl transferase AbiEii/AbiGii toxin family protein [Streptosporangiaceae bacterium]
MPVDDFHRAVAATALRAAARYGFALGGGNALIAYGLIDRPTQDVDLFTDREHGVRAAAGAVETALRGAGYTVDREDSRADLADIFDGLGDGLAEWLITGPDGAQMMLQMAYFERDRRPVTMDLGPVLDLEDVVGWKVVALASRVEPRDYVDTAAALGRFTIGQLIGLAQHLDPGLTDRDFADAGRQLDRMPDGLFARYGLSPADVTTVRERFQAWPR